MCMRNVLWGFVVLVAAMIIAVMVPAVSRMKRIAERVICGVNMQAVLGVCMRDYVHDSNDLLPTENWCDFLIEKADVIPKYFLCPSSDAILGESCYAMNKDIAGKELSKMPKDMVLFFETDMGRKTGPRTDSIGVRRHYEFLKTYRDGEEAYNEKALVYGDRFNQLGGPEDVLLRHDMIQFIPGRF